MRRTREYKWEPDDKTGNKDNKSKLNDFANNLNAIPSIVPHDISNKPRKERQRIIDSHLFAMNSNSEQQAASIVVSVQETVESAENEPNNQTVVLKMAVVD